MVDLTAKPFNLNDEAVAWVNDTIEQMTDEQKIGQLFVNMGAQRTEEYLTGVLNHSTSAPCAVTPAPPRRSGSRTTSCRPTPRCRC